jgi:hypothetical protein
MVSDLQKGLYRKNWNLFRRSDTYHHLPSGASTMTTQVFFSVKAITNMIPDMDEFLDSGNAPSNEDHNGDTKPVQ